MVEYTPRSTVSGGWVDKKALKSGSRAVIKTEAAPQPSNFKDEKTGETVMQDVCKIHIDGQKEPVNCNINKPTLNAFIKAFGTDSADWVGKEVSVQIEKTRVGGKAVLALYLIPDGFELADDANGYAVVQEIGGAKGSKPKTDTDRANEEAQVAADEARSGKELDL